MRRVILTTVALAIAVVAVGVARAEDKANPTGTWKWSVERNGKTRETTLHLKLEGDKLTGTISGRNNDTPIEDATYKDGEVTFKVTREFNGNKFVQKYNGKLSGDTLKGKIEFDRNGETQSRDWEAKRSKD